MPTCFFRKKSLAAHPIGRLSLSTSIVTTERGQESAMRGDQKLRMRDFDCLQPSSASELISEPARHDSAIACKRGLSAWSYRGNSCLLALILCGAPACEDASHPGGLATEGANSEIGLSAEGIVDRYSKKYSIPNKPRPFLEGLSDSQTPEQLSKERELLGDYLRVRSPRTAGKLGALYTQTESGNYAIAWLTTAITAIPEEAEYWYWLGVDLYFLAEFEEAKVLLERSRDLGGQSASLERFVGEVELELEHPDLAKRAFSKSLELDSKGWHARMNLAGLQEDSGDLEEARSNLEFLIRLDPEHPTPHFRLARVLRKQGETEQALRTEKAHRRAAILDDLGLRKPGTNPIRKHLAVGWALAAQQEFEDALVEYRAAANMTLSGELADEAEAGIEQCLQGIELETKRTKAAGQPQ
ncbi:MAG: tetratricopeptide (TPR) repeat protein [Planctomycetota bacterium]|jgi:tetratricopeptide (TPR) repeat protein